MGEVLLLSIAVLIGYLAGRFRVYQLQNRGEVAVSNAITKNLTSAKYHLLNNITLPVNNETTQVDHILVSRYGIFVIETKHYKGWLFANPNSQYWTQVIFKQKFKFQNPIRQNDKHLRAVQSLLYFLPKEHIHSVVIFTGDAEFRTPKPAGVFSIKGFLNFLNAFTEEVISENRLQFCVGKIECQRLALTEETDVNHRARIQRKFGNPT